MAISSGALALTLDPLVTPPHEQEDRWTIRTWNGSLAAHNEHTLVISAGEPVLVPAV